MAWAARVRDIRADMIGGIAALSDTLGTMQRSMADLVVQMRQVIAIQGLQGGKIGRFNVLLSEIVAVMSDWEKRLNDPSRRLLLDGITGDLAGLSRIRLFFHFLATITAIQITREKSVELMSFVDDLKSMPDKIEVELARAQSGVENFRKAQESMARDASSGAQVLARAEQKLASVAQSLVEAERSAEVASGGASRLAQRAMESAEAAVVRLVKAFQFSDSAAQRLEHVEAILAAGAPGSAHAALGAAQLQALADDLTDIVRELDDSLGAIGQIGRSVLDGFAPSQEEMRKMLASQTQIQGLFTAATDTARPTLERISAQCESLASEITEVLARLEALDDIGQAISLAAVNARVKAAHAALAKQELGYIAMAVNESAGQAVSTIAVAVKGMEQLRSQLDALDYPGMAVKLSELTEVVDAIQTTLSAAESREAEMSEVEVRISATLDALDGVTVSGQQRLADLPRLAKAMADAAAEIRRAGMGRVDAGALSGLIPLYTMAREREVHAMFTGQPVEQEALNEDLDSILF
ncbi:hypothetical protein NX862_09345 [Rhodobacter sp. KR11]|uniref:hypothetical protein n=1 Tax=Rhodobacter sp. KR11 TaxID=2974588 RepID=UPI0022212C0E|nr:hypothetical protein [Rhodobacter sp. KR11]MCW1918960.1 hypothetical protein [Rhodobacter sp. KR11]